MPNQSTSNFSPSDPDSLSFESSLKELDSLLKSLESAQLPLQTLVERYDYGVQLIESCQKRLKSAELQITEIRKKSSKSSSKPSQE